MLLQLQVARKSIAQGPQGSKASILHASKFSIRPESEKKGPEMSEGEDDDEKKEVPKEGGEFSEDNMRAPLPERRETLQEEVEGEKFNPFYRLHIIGFLRGLLERLSLLMQLPEALKVSIYTTNIKYYAIFN